MTVRVEHDADASTYALGDDIEGVFIPFAVVDAAAVAGRITDAKAASESAGTPVAAPGTMPNAAAADDFNPSDFTDNGDGTFTRKADNVQGRFTPSGFVPVTTP